jgi:hypothetical protein
MDAEVQMQEELAAKWQAAIDSIEAAGLTVEDGVLTAPIDELYPIPGPGCPRGSAGFDPGGEPAGIQR